MGITRLKSALLATVALGVGGAATPAFAAEPAPTEIVQAPPSVSVAHASDEAAPAIARQAGLLAAGAAVLAALGGLIGWRRIRRAIAAAGPMAADAVSAVAEAPAVLARAVGKAVSGPFRFLAALAALVAFSLFGVGLYDVEWLGGLLAGALAVIAASMASARARQAVRVFARRR